MKKILLPVGIVATISFGALLLSGTATAQGATPPSSTCNSAANTHVFGTGFDDAHLDSVPGGHPGMVVQTLAAPIPAGTYDVITVSWDGYAARAGDPAQPNESYFVQFLDAGSNVLATTGATPDLDDGVVSTEWLGSIGQVSWTGADATQLQVVHSELGGPDADLFNSVHARCVGWTQVQVSTTTTTTTTTSTTTTSTTTTSTAPAVDSTTTTTTTTTTTAPEQPTVVLPEVEVAQPADPVQGQPTFTG